MKTSFKVISVLSALAVLSGCPDKGGGGGQTAVAVPTGVGINSNGTCTQEATIVANNIVLRNSLNECSRLQTILGSQSCQATLAGTNQPFTLSYGNAEIQSRCNGNPNQNGYPVASGYPINQPYQGSVPTAGYPNQPGYPQQNPGVATKNVICSIDVASGSAAGTISNMPVQVFANGSSLRLYANMQNTKTYLGGIINYTRYFSSEKLALLGLKYKGGSASMADTLTLSADLRNGKSVSATSFAGSEVRIEIAGETDNETSLVVSCVGQDQFNAGPVRGVEKVRCAVKENDNGKLTNATFLNSVDDLVSSGIFPSKTSDLVLRSEGQNVLTTSVLNDSLKVVTSLTSASSVTIKAPGYSSTTSCNLQ
jgi:hypothetical protein